MTRVFEIGLQVRKKSRENKSLASTSPQTLPSTSPQTLPSQGNNELPHMVSIDKVGLYCTTSPTDWSCLIPAPHHRAPKCDGKA